MKLNTLLEFQRCFKLLRQAEAQRDKLDITDYKAVVSSECQFCAELVADLKDHDIKQEPA